MRKKILFSEEANYICGTKQLNIYIMKNQLLTKLSAVILLAILFASPALAQNKIANKDFSEATKAPKGVSQIKKATGWMNANWGTADYYHKNATKCSRMGIPSNMAGTQDVFSGDGYAGIIAYYDDEVLTTQNGRLEYTSGYGQFSEYISTQLSAALQAGQTYNVKFRVSLSENSGRAISGLGMHFSNEALMVESSSYIKVTPQVMSSNVIDSKDKWVEVSGSFVAKGGEQYVTIGLFNGPKEVKRAAATNETNNKKAYYFIDGVEVNSSNEKDTDGDGIVDSEDKCPTVKGKPEYKGCLLSEEEVRLIEEASAHIYFETGSAVIKKESFTDLDKLVAVLKKHPEVKARVEGHTDNTGNAEKNLSLSKARAKSVADYLVSHGEPADHISSEGYGITRPIATNDTKEGRAKNRRVEIVVSAF